MKRSVIILAAGRGTRMESDLPKVLIELKDRSMIDYVVRVVEEVGVKPVVVVGYEGEKVKKFLGDRVDCVWQNEQKGTGHAVSVAKPLFESSRVTKDSVLVLYGDHPLIKKETIKKIFELQEEDGAVMTMATTSVQNFDGEFEVFKYYGRILRDKDKRIVAIREAKDCSQEEFDVKELNPGYYCFDAKWLWNNIDKLSSQNSQAEYYLTDLVELAVKQNKKIVSIDIDSVQCLGANTKDQLKNLEKFL